MNPNLRILIAYDGSPCADAALNDLKRAGMPQQAAVQVLSVADVWMPPPGSEMAAFPETFAPAGVLRSRAHAIQNVEVARELATQATARLHDIFPAWQITVATCADSPAWGILKQVTQFAPDLLVVGSHGRGMLARALLGSVSQHVAAQAPCSVRVARGRLPDDAAPPRIVVGVDGTNHSATTVKWVASRPWPAGTAVHVVAFVDVSTYVVSATDCAILPPDSLEDFAREERKMKDFASTAVVQFHEAGLIATAIVGRADPRRGILQEAERWGADTIFIGARGHTMIERILGTTSQFVVARAHCTVELVR